MRSNADKFGSWILAACLSLLPIWATGCSGDSGPQTAKVSGLVVIGGEPVPGVEVHFLNMEYPNHNALGITEPDGTFKIVQGAVVGTNTVYFSKVENDGMLTDPDGGMDAGQFEAMAAAADKKTTALGPKQIVPQQYSTAESKLTFDVPAGGTTSAVFDL
jgi:hypothetical protein